MKRAGYTLVEVMTAVVVMTIGATGIVAMQGAAVRANQDANETSTAVNFGSTWIERVKRDARRWIANGSGDLANTNNAYLNRVLDAPGVYFLPAATAPEQVAADIYGFDSAGDFNTSPPAHFCVNLQLTVVQAYNGVTQGMNIVTDANAIRADVRVWWHRSTNDANRTLLCRAGPLTTGSSGTVNRANIRKTYLSTVVTWRLPGWP
ncbi:MAG TPA: prepilin-type N-terminal cleavage/methylation domain-containing protein [Polyangiales bacterium]